MNYFARLSVTAQSFDRQTGKSVCASRVEDISVNNAMFSRCRTVLEIKEKYEGFWNKLNDHSDLVFVQKIDVEWF